MPPKVDHRDWDRYFRPGAPRRGGPLRVLANLLLICFTLGILGGAAFFAWSFGRERAHETALENMHTIETANAAVLVTHTAQALETAQAMQTTAATPIATASTEIVVIGHGSVIHGGNLRTEPLVVSETVAGQVCVGDQVDLLDSRTIDGGALWYRIRIISAAQSCDSQRVSVGSVGWVNAQLLDASIP
ncbi:MAG: SH3 domain-containing protein [Oscillochloris sp.]|nr:SH3 domain-containing protein [Oscillochloris sp.]